MPRTKFSAPRSFAVLQAEISPKDLDLATGLLYRFGIGTTQTRRRRDGLHLSAELPKGFRFAAFSQAIRRWEAQPEGKKIFKRLRRKKIRNLSWVEKYQKFLKPFLLLPCSEDFPAGIRVDPRGEIPKRRDPNTLYIEAGLAFGTGTHSTTRLASELLAEAISLANPREVLDLGCGTGILAMVARKLGAKTVSAVDNDPEALGVAMENLERNGIKGVKLMSSMKTLKTRFPVIVSNIGLNVLVELQPQLHKRLAAGGFLVLTGLLYKDHRELLRAYRALHLIKVKNRLGWSAFLFKNR